jgi:hypothetical protein
MDRVDLEPADRLHEDQPWAPARKKFDFSEKSNFWAGQPRARHRMPRHPMSANSAIEWTESTWNPPTGCTKIFRDVTALRHYAVTAGVDASRWQIIA